MEHILQYILPSILGDFIQGIDKNHMKTNFLSGKVSLQGVSLNPGILKSLNLPTKIVYSNIGKLDLKIPWLQRLKQPIEIYLEDLFVILEPTSSLEDFDIVEERIRFLEALTKECRNRLRNLNQDTPKENSSMDYYKVLILDNLQVTIKDIHLRFENQKKGYAFGFTLDEVNICTINERGQPEFLDRTLEENKMKDLYKRLYIQDISFYWDSKTEDFMSNPSYSEDQRRNFMKKSILKREAKDKQIQPILMISLESHLVFKNVNKPEHEKEPRYRLEIDLKPININLDNNQVNQMISLVDYSTGVVRNRKRKYKLPQLSEEEKGKETETYKKALSEFLMGVEDPDFKFTDELSIQKKKNEIDVIRNILARLPNDSVATASKDIILKDEKRRLLLNMEKKLNKKGLLGFWKADPDAKKENEEIQKFGNFFDAFIQENSDKIGKSLMRGFLLQINLNLSEASVLLLNTNANVQQGVLAMIKKTKLKFDFTKHDDYDMTCIEFSLQDIKMSLQKRNLKDNHKKEIIILTKYNPFDVHHLAKLELEIKDFVDGKSTYDLKGDLQGTEFKFIPELVVTLKKFFQFERNREDDNFADLAYEKMVDLSKNAQGQIKSLINEYSSTVSISLTWASAYIILPLNPSRGKESDCWLLSIHGVKVYTDPENAEKDSADRALYNNLKYELERMNMKYAEKVLYYYEWKRDPVEYEKGNKTIFPLMEDTKIGMELKVLRKVIRDRVKEDPEIVLNFYIGDISVNVNTLLYKKLYEIKNCLDFSHEKDLNEYLETEKNMIMKSSDGLFKVYFKDYFELTSGWTEYIMVCSGFYLYFFRNYGDVEAAKYVFTKRAKLKIESDTYDFPHILKLTNKFEEVVIAFENEGSLDKLVHIIQSKNEEYAEDYLSVDVEEKEVEQKVNGEGSQIEDYTKSLFKLAVVFEGLTLNLFEQFDKRVNQISLWKLSIELLHRCYDQGLKIQLTDISVSDFTLGDGSDPNHTTLILASNSEALQSLVLSKELIVIDARFLDHKHPEFEKNLSEIEVSILFNTLFVNYIPERVYYLLNFFIKPISPQDEKGQGPSQPNPNEIGLGEPTGKGKHYISKKADNQKEIKFLTGELKVSELSLTMYTQISHLTLAKATLQRLIVDININKNASQYKGSLKNIQIFDLSTHFPQNMAIEEEGPYEFVGIEQGLSILEFEFIQREEHYMKQLGTEFGNILNMKVNSIRLNYVHQPVMRIINYFNNFMLGFDFASAMTYNEKVIEAIQKTRNPKFLSINVTFNNPKILLKAQPPSQVWFELDLERLTINNEPGKNPQRILKTIPSLEFVFGETYKIKTSEIKLIKKTTSGTCVEISNPFRLDLDFQRCLWYDEYIIANNISQDEKFSYLDNGFYINGSLTPIFLKFNQEDYLDVMDAVFLNLAFDDMQDPQYHIDIEALPEMKDMNTPSPINLMIKIDYIAGMAMDQVARCPLAKIIGLSTGIGFKRNRNTDKDVEITINKLIVNYFEKDPDSNIRYLEKTLLGQSYAEKEVTMKDEDTVNDIFTPESAAQERLELEKVKDTLIKVEYKMLVSQDRDLLLSIQQIKVILNLEAILRLKDFFMLPARDDENSDQVQIELDYKSKSQYRGIIEKAEISIPVSEEATVIVKGAIIFDWIKYDITDIVIKRKDFLESTMINLNLVKSEIFVFHQYLRHNETHPLQKRSIIFPFSFTYKSKEYLSYEKTHNTLLAKYDNLFIIDKIVLRVSSSDSMVASSALKFLGLEYERYKKLPPFPQESKHSLRGMQFRKSANVKPNASTLTVISQKHKIAHDGIQIRVINDLSGVSIPLLDFSFHSSRENSSLGFEKSMHHLQGRNCLQISSSFYNSRVSKWEPIIEKWEFILELDFDIFQEYGKRIDVVNPNQEALNINISDEMLKVILLTWKDWNESFEQFNTGSKNVAPLSESRLMNGFRLLSTSGKMAALLSNESVNDIEYVSPFTLWNDTGYPLHVEPFVLGTYTKGISCKKKLYLSPGDQQDLLMEWNIDKIFEASTKESVLERMKVSVWLEHPVYGTVSIPNIDIHNFGTKKRKLEFKSIKKEFPIICNVFNYKKKKLVRFSSPIVIKNSLPKPIVVQIFDESETTWSLLNIAPNSSAALPFDRVHNPISFHLEKVMDGKKGQVFKADPLIHNATSGIVLGNNYALLRSQIYRAYATIFLEPLIIIKNCLPFVLYLELEGKKGTSTKNICHVLETQDEVLITEFSPDYTTKLRCTTDNFMTNDYIILPTEKREKDSQTLFFNYQNKTVKLNPYTPATKADSIFRLLISAKMCVINESTESLNFYACNESTTWVSPFSVLTRNGNEIVIFDSITAMKIRPKNEGSSVSDFISLNRLGVFPMDVYDGLKQILNLGIQVTNVLSVIDVKDRQHNIFTKVIRILPRYIISNKTKYTVSFYQCETPEIVVALTADERAPFHFSKNTKDKLVKVRLHPQGHNQTPWKESGVLDVSSPGNLEFLVKNESQTQEKYLGITISIQDASLFITLQEQDPSDTAIQIENNMNDFTLLMHQYGVAHHDRAIPPHSKLPFAWTQPCLNNIIIAKLDGPNGTSSEIQCKLSDINTNNIETVMFTSGPTIVSYCVSLYGKSRVVKFYTGKENEENKEDEMKFLFRACLPSLGFSLISAASHRKYELAYISISPFLFVMVDKNDTTELQVRIKSIIIDNNARHDVLYPVTLFPQNFKKLRERDLPFLDFVCKIKNRHKSQDMLYLKDLEFYLAETSIYLDAFTLNAISDFARSINKVLKQVVYNGVESYQYLFLSEKEKKSLFKSYHANQDVCLSWQTVDPNAATTDFIYIEKLAIHPIIINFTFKNLQFEHSDAFVLAFLKNALGKALANFDKAPIKLKGIDLRSVYGTKAQVFGTLSQRYKDLAKDTVMRIILSSNIIGNPVKFFDRISSGFNDLVDKPVQGFVEGPIEGGIGIIAGAGSFAAKTVGAAFNSLHSIADSLANGLSSLTGDDDYIAKRERANTKTNSNALTGSVQAVKSVGKGFVGGITGLFEKPIEGGVKGGVGGFVKGMFVGAKGLVIKPVAGVLDGVSKLTQGVSNTFDEDSNKRTPKGRMPRVFYGKERIFMTYDIYHSTLVDFLYRKRPQKYHNLTLLGAVFLDEPSHKTFEFSYCLLLTLERIFFISFQKKDIVWKMKSSNMSEIFTNDDGVQIILKKQAKTLPSRLATIPCIQYEKKAEVYTLLGILYEVVEETLS